MLTIMVESTTKCMHNYILVCVKKYQSLLVDNDSVGNKDGKPNIKIGESHDWFNKY